VEKWRQIIIYKGLFVTIKVKKILATGKFLNQILSWKYGGWFIYQASCVPSM